MRRIFLMLTVCLCLPTICQARILGRRIGLRDATAASYSAAQQVERTSAKVDQTTAKVDRAMRRVEKLGRFADALFDLLQGFRRQGYIEVEFRRGDLLFYQVRLNLPPEQSAEKGSDGRD